MADNLLGENPNDIARLCDKLIWAGASVGRSGLATQAIASLDIALWDMKAKRAGLPLAKLLGAQRDEVQTYSTSGGFLFTPLETPLENCIVAVESGIGGIKIKVGQPDPDRPGVSGSGIDTITSLDSACTKRGTEQVLSVVSDRFTQLGHG